MNDLVDDSITGLFTFFQRANFILRIAIFIAVLWPVSALLVSMVLPPSQAQTIVPLVDLVPLLSVLLIVLGTPFSIAILLNDPIARKGFVYFLAFIGVELSIGVYFALVPMSNDAGLAPLLTLAALALFFLWAARVGKGLRAILVILLIGITVTLIAGGRKVVRNAIDEQMQQSQQPTQSLTQPVHPMTQAHPSSALTVVTESQSPSQLATEPPIPIESAALKEPIARPQLPRFHPNWDAAVEDSITDFRIKMAPCILAAANLHCFFQITNANDTQIHVELNGGGFYQDLRIKAIDDQGKMYLTSQIQIGDQNGSAPALFIPPGTPLQGQIVFNDFIGDSLSLIAFGFHARPTQPNIPEFGPRYELIDNLHNVGVEHQEVR